MKHIWNKEHYKQICIDNEKDEQCMIALINGDFGWLMYLRENGDTGFNSRNPQYRGINDATMAFYQSNGQLDTFPLTWVLPVNQVERVLDFLKKSS